MKWKRRLWKRFSCSVMKKWSATKKKTKEERWERKAVNLWICQAKHTCETNFMKNNLTLPETLNVNCNTKGGGGGGSCTLLQGIQDSMEAILACHPATIHNMTGLGGKMVWTMPSAHRLHMCHPCTHTVKSLFQSSPQFSAVLYLPPVVKAWLKLISASLFLAPVWLWPYFC